MTPSSDKPVLWLREDDKWQLETGLGTTAFIFICNIICASSPSPSPSVLDRALREGKEKREVWLTLVYLGFSSTASVASADWAAMGAGSSVLQSSGLHCVCCTKMATAVQAARKFIFSDSIPLL